LLSLSNWWYKRISFLILKGDYNYLVALTVLCAGCLCSIWHNNNIDYNDNDNNISNNNMNDNNNNVNKGKCNANVSAWWIKSFYGKCILMVVLL